MDIKHLPQQITGFNSLVWIVLLGNFFVRASYYMVWPFLAIILYEKFQLTATQVGLLLTGSATFAVLLGFYTGNLADRFGRFPVLYAAVIVGVLSFTALAVAEELWAFSLAVFFACMPRTLWDAPSKALLADETANPEDRELALHLLYFLVNVGAAVGPLYGLWAGLNGDQFSFVYTAFAYLLLFAALILKHQGFKVCQSTKAETRTDFRDWIKVLKRDSVFLLVLLANLLIYLVFAQGDSSLVQYLTRAEVPELALLVSSLIIANSTVIVLCQFPLLHLMRNWAIESRLYAGGLILAASQLMMALIPVDGFWLWIVAVIVLSISEAILFSNINIYVDRLAPEHLKASYFGAAGLSTLGFALAPVAGGLVLDLATGPALFSLTAIISLLALWCYRVAQRQGHPVKAMNWEQPIK